jgi:hypothetical protein
LSLNLTYFLNCLFGKKANAPRALNPGAGQIAGSQNGAIRSDFKIKKRDDTPKGQGKKTQTAQFVRFS